MKISINTRFLTQPITGVQRYAREVTNKLISYLGKDNCKLFTPAKTNLKEFKGCKVFSCGGCLKGHLWEQLSLPYYFYKNRSDLLFSPCNTGPILIKNQVITIHDAAVYSMPEGYNHYFVKWYRFLWPRITKNVSLIITVSEFSKKEIIRYLNIAPEKIAVIYNGVSKKFVPINNNVVINYKSSKGLPDKFILGLASKANNKNFIGLLKSWSKLINYRELKDIWLVIAGGTFRSLRIEPQYKELIKLPRIFDIGYVDEGELPLLYNSAEVFVFPSLYEGFGLPPLEAMACGTPVVVSNAASLPEVVGDAGVYVDPYDVDDIARGIYRVLTDDNLRHHLREKGLARAKLFSWEKCARETLKVFEEAVEESRRFKK